MVLSRDIGGQGPEAVLSPAICQHFPVEEVSSPDFGGGRESYRQHQIRWSAVPFPDSPGRRWCRYRCHRHSSSQSQESLPADGKLVRDIGRKRSSKNGGEAGPAIPVKESPHTLAQISKINRRGKNQNIGSVDFSHYRGKSSLIMHRCSLRQIPQPSSLHCRQRSRFCSIKNITSDFPPASAMPWQMAVIALAVLPCRLRLPESTRICIPEISFS